MKIINIFLKCAMLLFCSLHLVACSSDDENEELMLNSELIGVWESVSERGWEKVDGEIRTEWEEPVKDIRVEFKNNGTLISYEYHDDKWNMDESAKWESKDGKIYSYYYEDDELIEETVTISKLTSTSLIIYMSFKEVYEGVTYETWSEMEYRKVK